MRYYWENARLNRVVHDRLPAIEVPCGVALFPDDLVYVPRKCAEEQLNLVRWTEMPRGGHFAAAEQPELLVEDLRRFFMALPDSGLHP
jgi:pimeloyl-ACP methyl ester carboxylesterase